MTENSGTIVRNREVWRSLIAEWKEMSLDFKMLNLSSWYDILVEAPKEKEAGTVG